MHPAATRLNDLAEAIREINERATSFVSLQAQLRSSMEVIEDRSEAAREKQQVYEDYKQRLGEIADASKEEAAYNRDINALVAIFGESSSVALTRAHDRYIAQLGDLDKAAQLGFISDKELTEAQKKASEVYADLEAAAKGQKLAGQAGADLFRMARHPGAAVAGQVGNQLSGIASGLMGLLNGLPIMGGLWGLMMHGYAEADRLTAEAGEIANIVGMTGEKALGGAVKFFAGFQEQAQKFMGISRHEVQSTLKTFLDAGLKVRDVLDVHEKSLGLVGHDAMTLTLALDKHFEWAAGSSAAKAVDLVKSRGVSLEYAVTSLRNLAFGAQNAGISVSEFLEVTTKATSEMAKFGVDAENVGAVMLGAIERYKELGVSAITAQGFAAKGVEQVSAGLHQSSIGLKSLIGTEMGYGSDLDAAYAVQDAVATKDKDKFEKLIRAAYKISREQVKNTGGGSDNTRQREWLEPTFGMEGSRLIVEMGKALEERGGVKAIDAKGWEDLKGAFTTEGEKVSAFQKSKEKILAGMAQMGQGIFQLISNFAAIMIISIKAMMSLDYVIEGGAMVAGKLFSAVGLEQQASDAVRALGGNMSAGREERIQSIKNQYTTYLEGAQKGALEVLEGTKKAGGGVGDIFGPILQPITKALRYRIGTGGSDDGPSRANDLGDDEEKIRQALLESGEAYNYDDLPPMEAGGEISQVKSRAGAPEVVNAALSQTGTLAKGLEPNKFSRGRAEWWCMDFVGWAYEQIGYAPWGEFEKSMWGDYKYKGFRGMEGWGRDKGYWRNPSGYIPKPGDIFFLERWSGSVPGEGIFIGEHVGMIVDILPDGRLWTIEGNAVYHGQNGVWSHVRDPGKSIFRGFVTTEKSGVSGASAQAKERYIRLTQRTHERKKKTIVARRAFVAESKKIAENIQKKAEAAGTFYSSTEALVSSEADVEAAAGGVQVQAQKVDTVNGSGVQVTVDLSQLKEIKLESGKIGDVRGLPQ